VTLEIEKWDPSPHLSDFTLVERLNCSIRRVYGYHGAYFLLIKAVLLRLAEL